MRIISAKLGLSIILISTLFSCNGLKEDYLEQQISCDVEKKVDFLNQEYVEGSDGLLLTGGSYRTDEEAHSGKYSIKLGGSDNYAFQVKLTEIDKDMFIRATIWRKGDVGNLALTSTKDIDFRAYSKIVNQRDSAGWEQLILESFIPPNYTGEEIKLFAMNSDSTSVYFDDLDLKVYRRKPYPEYPETDNIDLLIDEEDLKEIDQNREKSFWKGVITKKTKQSYSAIFKYGGESLPAEVRIKGDWLDHIQGDKLSFRIKLLEGNFMGMREFSIQQPGTRGFMNEYVIHKLFLEEDVLTTNYGFVPVKVNGKSKGIYAYEEHFAKHVVESRSRREGPILKFDESALWKINRDNLARKEDFISGPMVESSVILPFKKGKTKGSPTLYGNFIIAQNLLNQYRLDANPISQLFKVDKLAKFYSITNIARTWHCMRWHNERYYYDPLSSKIEIIAYDCYTQEDVSDLPVLTTPEVIETTIDFDYDRYLSYSPFNDPVFANAYREVMGNYVNTARIKDILEKYENEILFNTEMIQKEYGYYHYSSDFILNAIDSIASKWATLDQVLKSDTLKAHLKIEEYNYKNVPPIEGMSLQAFASSPYDLQVRNFHAEKLFLIAYQSKDLPEQGIISLKEPVEFPAYVDLEQCEYKTIKTAFAPSKIYFKTSLEDTLIYDSDAYDWPAPGVHSPRQELLKSAVEVSTSFCEVNDSTVIFKKGKHVISEPLIIAAGRKVIIPEEVSLDFVNKSFFMSFSPIYIEGKKEALVTISSSDSSAMGFTIIDASARSSFNYVVFEGFNTLAYKGWNLTGAVSFYQSDVDVNNSTFLHNHCEDALNIVRSDFSMENTRIAYAYADGFDADFVTGNINASRFEHIGNDGADFSGSLISMSNIQIDDIGDKGVSGGESSTVIIDNIDISNANIGLASKDRSAVTGENISIKNSYCAFAVYQKKTEYEPARMEVKNVELEDIGRDNLLGLKSIFIIDGEKEIGIEQVNIDSLYGF